MQQASVVPPREDSAQEAEQIVGAAANTKLADVEKKWPDVIEAVKRKRIALGSLLIEGWPTRVEGINIELAFARNNGFHITSVERQAAVVEEAIEEVLGVRLKLKCVRIDKEKLAGMRKMPARVDKRAEFAKLEKEDSLIKEIVEKFAAEFIK